MFRYLYTLLKYIIHQFHNNLVLFSTLILSILYYIASIYVNSQHEFDKIFGQVLFSNVRLSKEASTNNLSIHNKYYQINTMALLTSINASLSQKDYDAAIKTINAILKQHQNNMPIKNYFTIRKGIIGIMMHKTYEEYQQFIEKEISKSSVIRDALLTTAKKYYEYHSDNIKK